MRPSPKSAVNRNIQRKSQSPSDQTIQKISKRATVSKLQSTKDPQTNLLRPIVKVNHHVQSPTTTLPAQLNNLTLNLSHLFLATTPATGPLKWPIQSADHSRKATFPRQATAHLQNFSQKKRTSLSIRSMTWPGTLSSMNGASRPTVSMSITPSKYMRRIMKCRKYSFWIFWCLRKTYMSSTGLYSLYETMDKTYFTSLTFKLSTTCSRTTLKGNKSSNSFKTWSRSKNWLKNNSRKCT